MKNTININVERKEIIHKEYRYLGVSNENNVDNLNIILDKELITDTATPFLEIEFPDTTKKFIEMDKISTSEAEIKIKNSLLKQEGYLTLQFVLRSENNIVFKSEIFKLHVKEAINATESIEDEYPNVLDELENLKLRVKNIEENPSGSGNGKDGTTFIPHVSEDGILSWTNDGELENPKSINIKGKDGENGQPGADGQNGQDGADGVTPIKGTDYFTEEDIEEIIQKNPCNKVNDATLKVNSNIAIQFTPIVGESVDYGWGGCYYYKKGTKVTLHIAIKFETPERNHIYTMPEGFRPGGTIPVWGGGADGAVPDQSFAEIYANGDIYVKTPSKYALIIAEYDAFEETAQMAKMSLNNAQSNIILRESEEI